MRKAGCKNVGALLSLQVLCLNGFYNKNFMGDNDRECRSRGTTPCSRSSNSSLSWGLAPEALAHSFCPRPCTNGLQVFAEKLLTEHAVLLSCFLFTASSPLLLGLRVPLLAGTECSHILPICPENTNFFAKHHRQPHNPLSF